MNSGMMKPKTVFRITGIALTIFIIVSNGLTFLINLAVKGNSTLLTFFQSNNMLYLLINYACIYGIGFLVYWLIARNVPHVQPSDKAFKFGELFQYFCICYSFGILSNIVGTVISIIGGNQSDTATAITDLVGSGGVAAWVIMIIVGPVVEELIFRKIIIDRTKRFGEKYAIVFSALCFGLFHLNLQQFVYAISIGAVLGYVYSRSGRIHYTMIIHSLINAIGYLVTMIASPALDSMGDISVSSLLEGNTDSLASLDYGSLLLIWIVEMLVLAIIALGIVFFIRKVRTVRFDYSSPDCLKKKEVFRTIYLNIGVILFVLVCVAGIVISFIGGFAAL